VHRGKLSAFLALGLVLLAGCTRQRLVTPAADLSVTFLDVGQGDAALLRTPEGRTVLFDTGTSARTAEMLRRAGVRRIDLLVLSHSHADHFGGLAAIARSIPISETWYSGLNYKGRARRVLEKAASAQIVSAGAGKSFGNLKLSVLHPEANPVRPRSRQAEVNNNSVVVKAEYGDSRYLFPGDCELGCWEEMFKFHRSELRSSVLKAAHHGSENGTNSGVLINVRPSAFVISAGRDNEYGHPHPIVLRLVEKLGAQVFRTDLQGSIRCAGVRCGVAE
jgi:competence protein ComEC